MQRREIASVIFALAAFPLDYLVYILLPSISTIIIAIATIAMLAIAAILWFSGGKEETKPIQTRSKPQIYSISLAQEPEIIRMQEIRVRLNPNNERRERAWFYVVSLSVPLGAESATEVQPMFKFPTTNDVYPLRFIPTSGKPWIHVTWPLPPAAPDFDKESDKFAKALVLDKERGVDKLNLEEGHPLKPFIFVFTVDGEEALYFPTPNLICFKMPTRFRTTLYLQAAGRPPIIAKRFEIDARNWKSVSVNEVRDSP